MTSQQNVVYFVGAVEHAVHTEVTGQFVVSTLISTKGILGTGIRGQDPVASSYTLCAIFLDLNQNFWENENVLS